MLQTPPFDEALAQFRRFVSDHGLSTNLAWAFREDVTNCRRAYWARVPIPAGNAERARSYYERGRRAGLGVSLVALGRIGGLTVCYVWAPGDERAASYAMQRPLKLQVVSPPYELGAIRSGMIWFGLRLLNRWRRCVTFAAELPSRQAIAA